MDDDAFAVYVADRLAELPAVRAVTLGGSRAEGTHRPDSDWDCRDDDHGASGVAGDGEAITCEDNDGWRWEYS